MKSSQTQTLRRARPWLGTLVDITLHGEDATQLDATMAACFAAIERVHKLMSFHDAASDVSRLNDAAAQRPVKVAAEVIEVLKIARRVSVQSAGLFDITVANRLVARGHLPARAKSKPTPADNKADWDDVVLLGENHVIFRRPLLIDLGGIAKGFAVDQALRVCRQSRPQLHAARINAGGDLARFGQIDNEILIRHPADAARLISIDCTDHAAVASSAYDHANPVHIAPCGYADTPRFISVTVLASSCAIADALTKVLVLDGSGHLAERCLAFFSANAVVIDRHGVVSRRALSPAPSASIQPAPAYG